MLKEASQKGNVFFHDHQAGYTAALEQRKQVECTAETEDDEVSFSGAGCQFFSLGSGIEP